MKKVLLLSMMLISSGFTMNDSVLQSELNDASSQNSSQIVTFKERRQSFACCSGDVNIIDDLLSRIQNGEYFLDIIKGAYYKGYSSDFNGNNFVVIYNVDLESKARNLVSSLKTFVDNVKVDRSFRWYTYRVDLQTYNKNLVSAKNNFAVDFCRVRNIGENVGYNIGNGNYVILRNANREMIPGFCLDYFNDLVYMIRHIENLVDVNNDENIISAV